MSRQTLKLFLLAAFIISGCVQPESTLSSLEGNNSPVIDEVYVDPPFITVGTTATIEVTASDPDGDQLQYSWSTALGDIIGSGAVVRYSAAYCCVGSNIVTVVVSDVKGAKVSEDIRIEINP
ncbi:MAG TPA: hypothetical protein VLH59_07070 [Ignavibacteriaceae bacterium]|nr:hypothetical protein [Ignavibacteriaceae bacterium]